MADSGRNSDVSTHKIVPAHGMPSFARHDKVRKVLAYSVADWSDLHSNLTREMNRAIKVSLRDREPES